MAATIPASASLSVGRFPNNRASSSSCPCPATALPRTFFLGFSKFPAAVANPSLGVASLPSRRYLRTHCQQQEQQQRLVVVPREQRWMFEESEINGPDIWNKTWYPKAADHISTEKTWYIVDATDKILGRLASTIAIYIRGKNLATYTPSVDMGAYVIVVNAEKVAVSGKKRTQKLYRRHSGRPGGMKVETFDQLQQRIPERIIEHAVRGMLPKGRTITTMIDICPFDRVYNLLTQGNIQGENTVLLGRTLFTHLKVYKGPDHPHEAQMAIPLPIHDKRIQSDK